MVIHLAEEDILNLLWHIINILAFQLMLFFWILYILQEPKHS